MRYPPLRADPGTSAFIGVGAPNGPIWRSEDLQPRRYRRWERRIRLLAYPKMGVQHACVDHRGLDRVVLAEGSEHAEAVLDGNQPRPFSRATSRQSPRARVRSLESARGLADFDQVAVGVAQVATDLGSPVAGRGQEPCSPWAPLPVDGLDVGHPDVEEAAGDLGTGRGGQGGSRLVLSRSPADVDPRPGIRQRDDGGLASSDELASGDVGVEAGGAFDVICGQEAGKEDALVWNREPRHLSMFPRIVAC